MNRQNSSQNKPQLRSALGWPYAVGRSFDPNYNWEQYTYVKASDSIIVVCLPVCVCVCVCVCVAMNIVLVCVCVCLFLCLPVSWFGLESACWHAEDRPDVLCDCCLCVRRI